MTLRRAVADRLDKAAAWLIDLAERLDPTPPDADRDARILAGVMAGIDAESERRAGEDGGQA